MITIDSSDLFGPVGISRLMAYEGMTKEQAFDFLWRYLDQHPELQQMIRHCHESPQGRAFLADVRTAWDAEGLPVLWDRVLDLMPAS
jgi:hypothetical protein